MKSQKAYHLWRAMFEVTKGRDREYPDIQYPEIYVAVERYSSSEAIKKATCAVRAEFPSGKFHHLRFTRLDYQNKVYL
jgi:hypothetical protein